MSKRSEGLVADLLSHRWSANQVANGTTVTASVPAPQSSKLRHTLDTFYLAIANENAAGFTVLASIRDASVAGTTLLSWQLFVPGSQTAQVSASNLGLQAGDGKAIFFTTDTVLASVSASVNSTGWTDQSQSY